jgi:hypothetical protein
LNALPYIAATALYLTVVSWATVRATALDYAAYLIGAYGFVSGQPVYQWGPEDFQNVARHLDIAYFAYPYRYSPITALLISPLLAFPYRVGLFLWSLINAAACLAAGELLSRLSSNPLKQWIIRSAVWLFVPFFVSLYAGQVNPLVTLIGALAVLAISKGRDYSAGICAAIAFLIKPTAIGLICYPLWKGKWKTTILFAVITALVLSLMTWMFGWGSLNSGVPLSAAGSHIGAYPPLQNFWGTAQRWLTPHEYGWSLAGNAISAGRMGWLLSLGLAVSTVLFCLPPFRPASWRDADWGMSLIAIALVVPQTWYHHYALLAIPLAILIAKTEFLLDALLAFAAWLAINIFGVAWHFLLGHTLLLDVGVLGALILWLGLARVSWRCRKAAVYRIAELR